MSSVFVDNQSSTYQCSFNLCCTLPCRHPASAIWLWRYLLVVVEDVYENANACHHCEINICIVAEAMGSAILVLVPVRSIIFANHVAMLATMFRNTNGDFVGNFCRASPASPRLTLETRKSETSHLLSSNIDSEPCLF